jgi:hypothetical protein
MRQRTSVSVTGVVFGPVIVGPGPGGANPVVMPSTGTRWSERIWALLIGAGALVLGTGALVVFGKVSAAAEVLGRLVPVPVWVTVAFAVVAVVAVVVAYRINRLQPILADKETIELDLRSTMPISFIETTMPKLWVYLRLTNHSCDDIDITNVTVKVSFGQGDVDLSSAALHELEAHSTDDNIGVSRTLEQTTGDMIRAFLASANPSKTIYLSATVSCEGKRGRFEVFRNFERWQPEADCISRRDYKEAHMTIEEVEAFLGKHVFITLRDNSTFTGPLGKNETAAIASIGVRPRSSIRTTRGRFQRET